MGILSKLAFWKSEDDLPNYDKLTESRLPDLKGIEVGTPPPGDPFLRDIGHESEGFRNNPPPFSPREQPQSFQFQHTAQIPQTTAKDMEVLSLKLDAIKTLLENINLRLQKIEQMANTEQNHETYQRRY